MIGVIDSGVGGLSVLREIYHILPEEGYLYIGDSAWCPYGNKTPEAIQKRVAMLTDFLLERGASLIVLACNSATIAAVEHLRASYPVPFVGMEPAVKPAVAITKNNVVGVLATEASLAGEKFHHLVSTHAQNLKVITLPCPDFVTLVENGELQGPAVRSAIKKYTAPMLAQGADVLVLGCTHYPFLKSSILEELPPGIHLLDTGQAVARHVQSLRDSNRSDAAKPGEVTIWTTGNSAKLTKVFPMLCPDLPATLKKLNAQ